MPTITAVAVAGVINDIASGTVAPAVTAGQSIPIDSDGWVLLVQFDSAVTIADATKLTVNITRPGYTGTVGSAATTRADVAYGVKQIRRVHPNVSSPLLPAAANAFYITIDNLIHASDTVSSMTFAAGFFAGQASDIPIGSGLITNTSAVVYAKPIIRPVFKTNDWMGSSNLLNVEFAVVHEWAAFGSQVARVEARCKVGATYGAWTGTSTQARSPQTPVYPARLPSRDDSGLGGVNGFDSYAFQVNGTGLADGAGSIVYRAYGWYGDVIFDSETDGEVYGSTPGYTAAASWPFVKDAAGNHSRIYAYVNRDGTGLAGTSVAGVSTSSADPGASLSYTTFAEAAKAARLFNNNGANRPTPHNTTSGIVILLRDVAGGSYGDNTLAYAQTASLSGYSDGLRPPVLASASYLSTGTTNVNCRIRPVLSDGTTASIKMANGRWEWWGLTIDGSGGAPSAQIWDGANIATLTNVLTRIDCDMRDLASVGASVQVYRWAIIHDFRVAEGSFVAGEGAASTTLGPIYLSVGSSYTSATAAGRQVPGYCLCSAWLRNDIIGYSGENGVIYGLRIDYDTQNSTLFSIQGAYYKGFGACNVMLRGINVTGGAPIARIGDDGTLNRQENIVIHNMTTSGERLNIAYNDQGWVQVPKHATLRASALDTYNDKSDYFPATEQMEGSTGKSSGGWAASIAVLRGTIRSDNNATATARVYYQAVSDFTTGTTQATDLADTARWTPGVTGSTTASGAQPRRTGNWRHRNHVRNFGNFLAKGSSDTAPGPTSWLGETTGRSGKVYNSAGINPSFKRASTSTLTDYGDYRPKSTAAGDSLNADQLGLVAANYNVTPNDLLGNPYRTDGTGAAGAYERSDVAAAPVSITPTPAVVALTATSPVVSFILAFVLVVPNAAALIVTATQPAVTFVPAGSIAPAPATIAVLATSPTVSFTPAVVSIVPNAASLAVTATQPVVTFASAGSITPTPASFAVFATSPAVSFTPAVVSIAPSAASIGVTATQPVVTFAAPGSIAPSPASFTVLSSSPVVSFTPAVVSIAPTPASLVVTASQPAVTFTPAVVSIAPTPASLVVTASQPAVTFATAKIIAPSPASFEVSATSPTVLFEPGMRTDRVLDLSIADGRTVFLGGVGGSAWYRVHRLGIWTIDLDPIDAVVLEVDWSGRFFAPLAVVSSVEVEDGALVVSDMVADTDGVVFRVTGGGGVVRLTVTHGSDAQVERIALRVRGRPV